MVFQRLCAARCVGAGRAGGEPSGRRRLRSHECVLGLIILAAALGRLALFIVAPNIESPDTASYFASGNALFATGQMSSPLYMPLYPIVLHWAGYYGVIWLQIALSSATVYLVYAVTVAIWDDILAGVIAAAFCAAHPLLCYFAVTRLTETLAIFLLMLGVDQLYRRNTFGASISLTLMNLTRPSFDFILPILVMMSALVTEPSAHLKHMLRRLGIFAATYVVLMAPWWLHNYERYGQFVRLDLADGPTLILENSSSYEQHGFDWSVDPPWAPFSRISDPVARNEAMKRAAFDYIRKNPLTWFLGCFDRLRRFLLPWPDALTVHTTRLVSATAIQAICAAIIIPIFIGAAFAVCLFRERWRMMSLALIPIVYLTALHTAFYAIWRYRIPLDPLLMTIAGGSFAALARASLSYLKRTTIPLVDRSLHNR